MTGSVSSGVVRGWFTVSITISCTGRTALGRNGRKSWCADSNGRGEVDTKWTLAMRVPSQLGSLMACDLHLRWS